MRSTALILALLALASRLPAQEDEWAKDIPYTTSWEDAIKAVSESGKLLFVYNGWEKPGI